MFINLYRDPDGNQYVLEQGDLSRDGALNSLMEYDQFWSEYEFTAEVGTDKKHNFAASLGECVRDKIHSDPGLEDLYDNVLWQLDGVAVRAANMCTKGAGQ